MSLVTSASLASYLRVENTEENALLDGFVTGAIAVIEQYINRHITPISQSYYISELNYNRVYYAPARLYIPEYPWDTGSFGITGYTADVSASDYKQFPQWGYVESIPTSQFLDFPYTVTASVGLQLHPLYAARFEPIINQCIYDLASNWYYRRDPLISSNAEGAVSIAYSPEQLPLRTKSMLNTIRIIPITR